MGILGDHTFQLKRGLLAPEPTPGFKVTVKPHCSSKKWQPLTFDPSEVEAFISIDSDFLVPLLFETDKG